jgi:hypothetical protein
LECSPHQYWSAWKKKKILLKKFNLLSSTWTIFFKLSQILGPIQVLASNVKKHDYNNLALKFMEQELRNNVPKNNNIIFIKSSTC